MVLGLAAWMAASATARRAAGVVAAEVAWWISAGCSGWMRFRGRYPDGVLVAGTAAGTALAAGAQPVPDDGGHRRGQQREPWLRQGGERRDPVVVQETGEGEDLGGAGDAEVPVVQGRRELGPGDHVSGLVAGEHDS